mgnify:CR=1 FL=1
MEAAQKKEAEDTAAMEKMLEEVEANLLTTTVGSKEASQFDYLGNETRYQPKKNCIYACSALLQKFSFFRLMPRSIEKN